ncbi:DUF308 domain-containing protein [Schumannella luteola]
MTSWIAPLLRAVPAVALAIVVTFSADHSAPLGLLTFGVFGVAAGAVITVFALRSAPGPERTLQVVQGILTVAAGIASLSVVGGGLPYLVFLVSGWAVMSGFLELYLGLRTRRTSTIARDHIFAGALTVLLAVVLLVIPPDFSQMYTVDEKDYELTASVIVVGLLGAYWAILGVFLIIGAFSQKWADAPAAASPEPTAVPAPEPKA